MTHFTQKLILGVLVLLGFGLWLHAHDAQVREHALAVQRADSLRVAVLHQQHAEILREMQDKAAHDSIGQWVTKVHHLSARADVWKHRADSLVALMPTTSIPGLDTLRTALALRDSVIVTQDSIIRNDSLTLAVALARWRAANASVSAWKGLALDAQAKLAASLRRTTPRFACVGGVGISAGLGGSAGGLTVACGLRL